MCDGLFLWVCVRTLYITAHLLAFPEANAEFIPLSCARGAPWQAHFCYRKLMSTTIIIWAAYHLASGNRSSVATRGVLLFCRLFAPRGHWLPPSHARNPAADSPPKSVYVICACSVFYPWLRRRGGPVHILWYLNWRARNERCCFLSIKFLVFALAPCRLRPRVILLFSLLLCMQQLRDLSVLLPLLSRRIQIREVLIRLPCSLALCAEMNKNIWYQQAP